MDLIFISADVREVSMAMLAGVDRIMVDLEINGKRERQGHADTLISGHRLADVETIRATFPRAHLMVRVNPMDVESTEEIRCVLEMGADTLMLPMFVHPDEAKRFIDLVGGQARTSLLLETAPALARLDSLLEVEGIDEIHVGLNDLHLSMHLDFMFELLAGGIVDFVASACHEKDLPFGFGGVGPVGHGLLPAELILGEHARLGSNQVILSRDFHSLLRGQDERADERRLMDAVEAVRAQLVSTARRDSRQVRADHEQTRAIVREIVDARRRMDQSKLRQEQGAQ